MRLGTVLIASFFALALNAQAEEVRILKDVSFLDADRTEKLDIYLPEPTKETSTFPAILIVHGGGWHTGDKAAIQILRAPEPLSAGAGPLEGAVEGATGFRLYDVRYSEGGGADNLVPNGDHSQGDRFWYIDGDPIGDAAIVRSDASLDVGSGNMLAISATADEIVFVNGESFPVTPGAEFEFSATFALDPSADGIGLTSLAFLNPDTRTTIRLEPVPQPLPPVVTDADGYFVIDLPALGDNTTLDLLAVGDLTTWPALLSIEL